MIGRALIGDWGMSGYMEHVGLRVDGTMNMLLDRLLYGMSAKRALTSLIDGDGEREAR